MATQYDMPIRRTRGAISWMANNSVTANLLMIALLLGGLIAALNLKQEVFPDFELDLVTILVPYPGASPEEIERGVILAIEEAIRGLEGVKEVTATAREGNGLVTAELFAGVDRQRVYQDVQQAVNRITTFPENAERARISLASRQRRVVTLVLYGDQTESVLRETVESVRDRLLQDPSISQITLGGIRDYEVSISLSRDAMEKYGLTLQDVAERVRRTAVELPGGGLKTSGGEILLRVKERRDSAREFASVPVATSVSGRPVLLGEIATLEDTFEDVDIAATYNGRRAVMVDIYRVGEQTPIEVADAAKRQLDVLNQELPPGLAMEILTDRSDVFKQRATLLLRNGAIGLVLVLLLLGVFLEARLAFWVMMGIPISFLGGFLILPILGVSINMISMFAFLIALGIVVDDAIVVGENVYEFHQRGMPFLEAAVKGAREVALPVTFSVLTNIVAFMPLVFIPGFIGKIWRVTPAVVCTVFAISLIECLFILPAHLGHAKDRRRTRLGGRFHAVQQRFSLWFVEMVERTYGPILRFIIRFRYATVATAIVVLLVTIGFIRGGRVAIVPFPRVDADFAIVTAVLPYGSAVDTSERVRDILEQAAWRVAEAHGGERLVTGVFSEIGGSFRGASGGHVVEVRTQLTKPDVRPLNTRDFTNLWRRETGRITGLEALLFEADRGGPGSGAAISVELAHTDSQILEQAANDLADHLAGYPLATDIDAGVSPGKPQLDFSMLPEGESLGLTSADVARQVRNAFHGAEALRQQRGRNEVKVQVRLPEAERISEYDIDVLRVKTPAGAFVPLREVARIERGRAYTSIERRDARRTVTVTADVSEPSETGRIVADIRGPENDADGFLARWRSRFQPPEDADAAAAGEPAYLEWLKRRYPGLSYSFQGRQQDFTEGMDRLRLGFILALIAIYALLAIPFKSYVQPLIVMVSIPFGIVGAVIGHAIMGYALSMISMMGIVALAGVVVNDSLVLIDYANRQKHKGAAPFDAIHGAGVRRFRPVMLTTLTTFGGLAPMIFETSRQARFMIPMAISLGYGILFATAITLALVPSLYMIGEDFHSFLARRRRA